MLDWCRPTKLSTIKQWDNNVTAVSIFEETCDMAVVTAANVKTGVVVRTPCPSFKGTCGADLHG
jgi:hypothetical protein